MRAVLIGLLGLSMSGAGVGLAGAEDTPPGAPGVIVRGSTEVSVGGLPAARSGDGTHDGATLREGSSNVFINGRPAVTVGDRTHCGSVTVRGSSNVYVNGKPLARVGDTTTGCPSR